MQKKFEIDGKSIVLDSNSTVVFKIAKWYETCNLAEFIVENHKNVSETDAYIIADEAINLMADKNLSEEEALYSILNGR